MIADRFPTQVVDRSNDCSEKYRTAEEKMIDGTRRKTGLLPKELSGLNQAAIIGSELSQRQRSSSDWRITSSSWARTPAVHHLLR